MRAKPRREICHVDRGPKGGSVLLLSSVEADARLRASPGLPESLYLFDYGHNGRAVLLLSGFELVDFPRQIFVGGQHLAHADKSAHDADVHPDGAATFQNRREHGYAEFRKGIGSVL